MLDFHRLEDILCDDIVLANSLCEVCPFLANYLCGI